MKESWLVEKENIALSKKLSEKLKISPITAQVLINRGIDSETDADTFLNGTLFDLPSPYLMDGMDKAVERVIQAITSNEKIAVYGDYDVDGVTATSLFYNFIKGLGADVTFYSPDRLTEGYGINFEAIKKLDKKGVKLIISGDCGISASDEVEKAKNLGIDFIITDHHKPTTDLPEAVSILNPHLPDCKYPGKEITGVGVLFNLAIALRRALRDKGYFDDNEPNLGDYLDLVALGTVADCAPLINVNRIFVKEGIKRISSSKRLGIKALKQVSSLNGEIDSFDIGFKLGPRINAVGRLSNADEAIELFITDKMEKALEIANRLNTENSNRQNIEKNILEEVTNLIKAEPELDNSNSIVLSSRDWHPGVIGIVASRIVDMFNKPTFLIAIGEDGIGKGSGRGIEGINLFNVLSDIGDLFEQFGGHELAAGITIKEENIELFRRDFSLILSEYDNDITSTITIDCKVRFEDINIELLDELGILEPFGIGNPKPLFLEESLELISTSVMKEKHLRMKLRKNGSVFNAIWFNFKELPELYSNLDILYTPEINIWNGRREIRFNIRDISII